MEWWSIKNNLTEQSFEELNDSVSITNSSLTSQYKICSLSGSRYITDGLIITGDFMPRRTIKFFHITA